MSPPQICEVSWSHKGERGKRIRDCSECKLRLWNFQSEEQTISQSSLCIWVLYWDVLRCFVEKVLLIKLICTRTLIPRNSQRTLAQYRLRARWYQTCINPAFPNLCDPRAFFTFWTPLWTSPEAHRKHFGKHYVMYFFKSKTVTARWYRGIPACILYDQMLCLIDVHFLPWRQ